MISWLIIILLSLGWYIILSKRYKLVESKKRQKRHLEAVAQQETKTLKPPEYFIWDLANDFGED